MDLSNQNSELEIADFESKPAVKDHFTRIVSQYNLSDKDILVAKNLMLPRAFRKNYAEMSKELGTTFQNYYLIVNKPGVQFLRRELTKTYFQNDIPDVLLALRNNALAGDSAAAKTFLAYVDEAFGNPEEVQENRKFIPIQQVNLIVKNLTQKFYDQGSEQNQRSVE